ncbi:hypothetical protein ACQUZK_09650, partial [Streptococcus pyogenes]|uniref:hypothetical protein n=1 Tax=Streptococcus pyogenes TaxID=1314 RepID=UPI003DA0B100
VADHLLAAWRDELEVVGVRTGLRVMTVRAADDGPDDDAADDADDLDPDDPDDPDLGDEDTGGAPPLPEPRRRTGTVLGLGSALVGLGATRPAIALLVAVVLAVLVR